ncbi:MAG: lysophospholipid acyltransferase family protein [bacterium]|nr:lysophospholipid acyltransferase family protein [bacterium]
MERVKMVLIRLAFVGAVGTFAGILICLLEALWRVRFRHFERFPFWQEKVIVVSNHPSTRETYLIPLMFFPWWFRRFLKPHPLPISTPDRKNFPYFEFLKEYFVFIDRGKENTYRRGKALVQMKRFLQEGANVVLFIEGTRTGKAQEKMYSQQGKEMGIPKARIGYLVRETGATVVPLWVDASWKFPADSKTPFFFHVLADFLGMFVAVTKIKSGLPLNFNGQDKTEEEITEEIIEAIFKVADER